MKLNLEMLAGHVPALTLEAIRKKCEAEIKKGYLNGWTREIFLFDLPHDRAETAFDCWSFVLDFSVKQKVSEKTGRILRNRSEFTLVSVEGCRSTRTSIYNDYVNAESVILGSRVDSVVLTA